MVKKDDRPTVEEFLARLAADPKHQAFMEEHKRKSEALARNEAPIVADLRKAGYGVDSVYDLVNTNVSYPEAVPVLLAHLGRPYHLRIREGIARALTVPEAKPHLPRLIEEFRKEPDTTVTGPKGALANAIEALGGHKEHLQEIVELVLDPAHGPARASLVYALGKSKDPIAGETLEGVKDDPAIHLHVAKVLRKREEKRQRDAQRQAERQAERQKS